MTFAARHIGPNAGERRAMLDVIGVPTLDALIDEALPPSIRLTEPPPLPDGISEFRYLREMRHIAAKNQVFRSYLGLGYYNCLTPSVIVRNVLENPGWYTPYTPYQAEIAQGRLEGLLNFQTMVAELTGMEVANASLLDEATAAAEAMTMLRRVSTRAGEAGGAGEAGKAGQAGGAGRAGRFFVAESCFPQTIDVLRTRAEPLGIELVIGDPERVELTPEIFGALVQTPDEAGVVRDLSGFIKRAHDAGVLVAVATDLLAMTLLTPPGEAGADVVVGSAQRFGVPMGYGGPHAAFFATRTAYVRQMPGRLVGVSVDAHGKRAYRMALQTREQHIRREKATSNICTAEALLANIAALYAVYHGPHGLTAIAGRVHQSARALAGGLLYIGVYQLNDVYFDTVRLEVPGGPAAVERVKQAAEAARMNFRYRADGTITISLDETTEPEDLDRIAGAFAAALGTKTPPVGPVTYELEPPFRRTTAFLTHPVFNSYCSETQMMRYVRGLERKDIGLDTSMIPLGSCTMKLNAASEMLPLTWTEFGVMHPFAPPEQAGGYRQVITELEASLSAITGLAAVSLQPNSGAQGEFTGLMVIRAYHRARGQSHRDVVLIPDSAHGTNPASSAMAGMQVVVVSGRPNGSIDVDDLRAKATQHSDRLAALMVTYPSTHGVFEDEIQDICRIVHEHGGQVYMDGANMNAQVGLTSPAVIGADVVHLNLHKTFGIPHGGGGPGMGPIAVAKHLAPYLPGHPVMKTGGDRAIPAVSAAPWGSASILLISYGYIRMLGGSGMTEATCCAILNANYIKSRLDAHFPVLYTRAKGRVAHELIFDLRPLKQQSGIDETDVAKRLMDYGFHAPTVSFPVAGTLMVEPTESEAKEELDRFCDAMIAIRQEIQAVVDGKADANDNVLKNAPHTASAIASAEWTHPYTREQAVFPLPWVRERKFWPSVSRIDNPWGDRNLFCSCPPLDRG
jgi:glycine dehydrogenase